MHPNGGGGTKILELRTRVAAAAGAALFVPDLGTKVAMGDSTAPATDGGEESVKPAPLTSVVRSGLDVLVAQNFAPISGYTIGLVTNQTGIDAQGRRAIDRLAAAPGVRLAAIFSPEHGLVGDASTDVPNGRDVVPVRETLRQPHRRASLTSLRESRFRHEPVSHYPEFSN